MAIFIVRYKLDGRKGVRSFVASEPGNAARVMLEGRAAVPNGAEDVHVARHRRERPAGCVHKRRVANER